MKIFAGLLLAVLILFSGYNCVVPDGKMRIITEDNPPYNFTDERGNITGQSTEIVRSLISKTGSDAVIEVQPWSRGYEMVQKQPSTMLYSTRGCPSGKSCSSGWAPSALLTSGFMPKEGRISRSAPWTTLKK